MCQITWKTKRPNWPILLICAYIYTNLASCMASTTQLSLPRTGALSIFPFLFFLRLNSSWPTCQQAAHGVSASCFIFNLLPVAVFSPARTCAPPAAPRASRWGASGGGELPPPYPQRPRPIPLPLHRYLPRNHREYTGRRRSIRLGRSSPRPIKGTPEIPQTPPQSRHSAPSIWALGSPNFVTEVHRRPQLRRRFWRRWRLHGHPFCSNRSPSSCSTFLTIYFVPSSSGALTPTGARRRCGCRSRRCPTSPEVADRRKHFALQSRPSLAPYSSDLRCREIDHDRALAAKHRHLPWAPCPSLVFILFSVSALRSKANGLD
jgi:hypothetical protein